MSCSGGNRLKPSSHVCWKGTYKKKAYTAYNFACYPTRAPRGHNAKACREDGKQDDDCCAMKGHESCANGFRVQRSSHACFKNQQFTAYNYFCTPAHGGKNDALCSPGKCTSPGPNGKRDCWAGNGEKFSCSGGYNAKMTGKTAKFKGKTWKEYTCCPGRVTNCVTNACTSPDGQGGQDCWAGNKEPFTCKTGFTPKMTGKTAPYQGQTWHEYKCCPRPTACTPSACTSPNGKGGHDCWAGNAEPFTCAGGYAAKMTGHKAPNKKSGKTWYEYTCCKVGGKQKQQNNQNCVASACREYNKEHVDNDCCGRIGQTFCGDGFTLRYKKKGTAKTCEKNSPRHRGTCCIKNGQKHNHKNPQSYHNDKSKCRSHGAADRNCCALPGGGSCTNNYKMTKTKNVCFSYQKYKAYRYMCTPRGSMSGRKSNPKMCRENGRLDTDCCALRNTNTCAGGYEVENTNHVCYKNTQFTAYSYRCLKPDVVVVHG